MKTDKGEMVDWKKRFKVKKLEGLKKSQRIHELSKEVTSLKKDLSAKNEVMLKIEELKEKNGSISCVDLTKNFGNITQLMADLEKSKSQ